MSNSDQTNSCSQETCGMRQAVYLWECEHGTAHAGRPSGYLGSANIADYIHATECFSDDDTSSNYEEDIEEHREGEDDLDYDTYTDTTATTDELKDGGGGGGDGDDGDDADEDGDEDDDESGGEDDVRMDILQLQAGNPVLSFMLTIWRTPWTASAKGVLVFLLLGSLMIGQAQGQSLIMKLPFIGTFQFNNEVQDTSTGVNFTTNGVSGSSTRGISRAAMHEVYCFNNANSGHDDGWNAGSLKTYDSCMQDFFVKYGAKNSCLRKADGDGDQRISLHERDALHACDAATKKA